jgi:hypothetical protein
VCFAEHGLSADWNLCETDRSYVFTWYYFTDRRR